jgi:hypothetical protein
MFSVEPQYGQVAQMQELAKEAPISGAPIPGASTTKAPAAPGGAPPVPAGPMAVPFTPAPSGLEYYTRLANTYRALAATPGAGPVLHTLARVARQRLRLEHQQEQEPA